MLENSYGESSRRVPGGRDAEWHRASGQARPDQAMWRRKLSYCNQLYGLRAMCSLASSGRLSYRRAFQRIDDESAIAAIDTDLGNGQGQYVAGIRICLHVVNGALQDADSGAIICLATPELTLMAPSIAVAGQRGVCAPLVASAFDPRLVGIVVPDSRLLRPIRDLIGQFSGDREPLASCVLNRGVAGVVGRIAHYVMDSDPWVVLDCNSGHGFNLHNGTSHQRLRGICRRSPAGLSARRTTSDVAGTTDPRPLSIERRFLTTGGRTFHRFVQGRSILSAIRALCAVRQASTVTAVTSCGTAVIPSHSSRVLKFPPLTRDQSSHSSAV